MNRIEVYFTTYLVNILHIDEGVLSLFIVCMPIDNPEPFGYWRIALEHGKIYAGRRGKDEASVIQLFVSICLKVSFLKERSNIIFFEKKNHGQLFTKIIF